MVIYAFILFIIITIVIQFNKKEAYENAKSDIGNELSRYYLTYVLSILSQSDFIYTTELDFVKEFPSKITFNQSLYKELLKSGITYDVCKNYKGDEFWITHNKLQETLHKIMKPTMNKLMNDTFIKLGYVKQVQYPVIHFRCADTPFHKPSHYHFQKYSYFTQALKDIGNIKKIILLSCNTHLSNEQNMKSCKSYTIKLKEYLSDYEVDVQCNTNEEDFITMFYAPAVISTTSSFSFMSGYFGNGIYIQPNIMIHDIEICEDCDANYRNINIPHYDVDNYHNIDEVYKLLI